MEIVASPLVRAKNTAEHISGITGIPSTRISVFIEQNFGKYEGGGRLQRRIYGSEKSFR